MLFVELPTHGFASVLIDGCHDYTISVNDASGHIDEAHLDLRTPDHESNSTHLTHNHCGSNCPTGAVGYVSSLSYSTHTRSDFFYSSLFHLPPVLDGIERPPRFS